MPESKHFLQIMILEEDMHGEKSRRDLFMSSRALKFQKLSWMSEQSEPWWLPPPSPQLLRCRCNATRVGKDGSEVTLISRTLG